MAGTAKDVSVQVTTVVLMVVATMNVQKVFAQMVLIGMDLVAMIVATV